MMRLPWFEHCAPKTVAEAARILAAEGPDAMLIAGGTDLLPNMKRRQMAPKLLVSLKNIPSMKGKAASAGGLALGAGLTLTEVLADPRIPAALRQAAAQVATVHLRNMGTIGGNLCLDTRCNYYNQNYEWRKAIDFCLKKDGEICWVATASGKFPSRTSSRTTASTT
jgi:4-hydroxybenzoyl-CoA reductase subunit beta